MRSVYHNRGNLVFRQSSESPTQCMMPDAAVNLAIVELKAMGHYSLADRLMPISGKWWDKPWMPLDVASWEGALGTALATEGLSERSKSGLRHVRGTVAAWLTEYAAYEQADYEDEKATAERPCW